MKTFQAIGAVLVLVISLSIPVLADTAPGDLHTPGAPVPAENPIAEPASTGSKDGTPTIDGDISFQNIAEILWGLVSI